MVRMSACRFFAGSIVLIASLVSLASCSAITPPIAVSTATKVSTETSLPQPTSAPASTAQPAANPTAVPTSTPLPTWGIYERNARLGRGVNFGNALEAPSEGEWGVTLESADFQLIKDAGFSAIRVPIRWSAHAGLTAPYQIDSVFFSRIDWVITQAFSQGMAVVINMHNYDEFMAEPAKHEARFLAIWKQIAEHYKEYKADLFFEPYNEPHDIASDLWNDLTSKVIQTIRATNPTRPIVVSPLDYGSQRRLVDLTIPKQDRNVIVTVHYYLPFQFTHQGAEWVQGSAAWMGTKWVGNSNDTSNVDFDFQVIAQWAKENDRPIFLGEFGAYSKADMTSRARWTAYVSRAAESYQFSWAYWEFRSGFGVYNHDTRQWNAELLKALLVRP